MTMKLPTGKGFYIWQIPRLGSIAQIVELALEAKLGHVFIKIANGTADYGIVNGVDLAGNLANALLAAGIEPWGWQYVYNNYPTIEANKAVDRITETGVVGFDIDAEGECKNRPSEARTYCETLRAGLDDSFPVGLGSYRFPSLHPEIPWDIFRQYCDFDMPQVYWVLAHNPGNQLVNSYNEFKAMPKKLPYIATGSVYRQERYPYWTPTLGEVQEFMSVADGLGIAFNFWEWYDARNVLPIEIWDAIAEWQNVLPPPPPPPPLPKMVRTTAGQLNVRLTPMGTKIGYVPKGTLLGVNGEAYYNGVKWHKIGAAFVSSEWCEEIE